MPREAAAIKWNTRIDEGQVQWRTNQIVDQHRVPRHAQRFSSKGPDLIWLKMVREQRAADCVKAVVTKRKRQRVTTHGGKLAVYMRDVEVEQNWRCGDPIAPQPLAGKRSHIA